MLCIRTGKGKILESVSERNHLGALNIYNIYIYTLYNDEAIVFSSIVGGIQSKNLLLFTVARTFGAKDSVLNSVYLSHLGF